MIATKLTAKRRKLGARHFTMELYGRINFAKKLNITSRPYLFLLKLLPNLEMILNVLVARE